MRRQRSRNAEKSRMHELRVPQLAPNPFDAYFQSLIRDSLLRSAEAEYAYHRRSGHGLRARRAAQVVARLEAQQPGAAGELPRFGAGLLATTRIAWLATAAVLAWFTAGYGVRSWATGVADLALIAVTFAWFAVSCGSDV